MSNSKSCRINKKKRIKIMKNYKLHLSAAACALIAIIPAFGANPVALPARILSPNDAAALPNNAGVTTLPVTFKTAAYVNTSRLGAAPATSVQRGDSTTSAVYSGTDGNGPALPQPAQPAPPLPLPGQEYEFKQSADAVQAWATMTSNGVPYIFVRGFGQFSADGHASWRTTLPLPNGKSKVYLKITVPPVTVFGNVDGSSPALYRARSRAEVLLNGHPIYLGEAIRENETSDVVPSSYPSNCQFAVSEKVVHTLTFGDSLGFTAGDAPHTTGQFPSASQTVTLLLGTFDNTQPLDVQFLLNAETTLLNRCCHMPAMNNMPADVFCSASSAGFDYESGGSPVFYIQPQ
jgi:hypothetical protein